MTERHDGPSIDALLIDLGNVMTFFSHQRMIEQMAAVLGASPDDVHASFITSGVFARFETGRIDGEGLLDWAASSFGTRPAADAFRRAVADIFTPHPAMDAALAAVRAGHPAIRLVAITNTCSWHLDWVREHDTVLQHFDAIATSWEVGSLKPEPPLYHRAIELADAAPSRCFYTDDISAYVDEGRRLGLDAEVFIDAATFRSHLRARGLAV